MENLPKSGDILVLRESRRKIFIRNVLTFKGQSWYKGDENNKWMWGYVDGSYPNMLYIFDYEQMVNNIIYSDEIRDEKLNSLL